MRYTQFAILVLVLCMSLAACGADAAPPVSTTDTTFPLESDAFADGAIIPQRYTCDGEDISPPLAWGEVPAGTESLVLIVDDPDAPVGTWDHWIVFNIAASVQSLPAGIPADETVTGVGTHGKNGWQRLGYGGPCPPGTSEHRYQFRLYALDTRLDLDPGATKRQVVDAMEGHVLGHGELTARYGR